MCSLTDTHTYRQADRQTDRQTDRHTDRDAYDIMILIEYTFVTSSYSGISITSTDEVP